MAMSINWTMSPDWFRRDLLLSVGLPTDLVNDDWKNLSEGSRERLNKRLAELCQGRTVPQILEFTR